VGGRRWAKHIKYFQKFGEDFWVLAGDFNTTSPWDDDIQPYKEKITRISIADNSPYYKRLLPKNIFQKIRWKISLWHNKYVEKKYKGNFLDDSRFYVKTFLQQAEQIIREKNIQHICLTVGPCDYAMILPQLKKKYPQLKITLDFRDYWEDSFFALSQKQIQYETQKLNEVMQAVDLVLAPNEEMCLHYKTKHKKETYCLPHCVDINDIPNDEPVVNNSTIKIIYGGAFYEKIHNSIELIKQLIDTLSVKKNVEVNFYVSTIGYESPM
jgi:hypothetical protein